jgi:hypothetical protein
VRRPGKILKPPGILSSKSGLGKASGKGFRVASSSVFRAASDSGFEAASGSGFEAASGIEFEPASNGEMDDQAAVSKIRMELEREGAGYVSSSTSSFTCMPDAAPINECAAPLNDAAMKKTWAVRNWDAPPHSGYEIPAQLAAADSSTSLGQQQQPIQMGSSIEGNSGRSMMPNIVQPTTAHSVALLPNVVPATSQSGYVFDLQLLTSPQNTTETQILETEGCVVGTYQVAGNFVKNLKLFQNTTV